MIKTILLFLVMSSACASVFAATPNAGNLSCAYLSATSEPYVTTAEIEAAMNQNCDLTKPYSISVVDGQYNYAAQVLYCCILK